MTDIVYFVGAGFSAPAGLPVISNFLFRAKDQFFEHPEEFAYFKGVFAYIDGLSRAKNFTNIDLFNVEEVFSIADTHELLGKGLKKDLQKFIKDVVGHHTPRFDRDSDERLDLGWDIPGLLGSNSVTRKYVGFVAALLNAEFESKRTDHPADLDYGDIVAVRGEGQITYKIISLNYDTIFENAVEFINSNYAGDFSIPIAKLHGSVTGDIIPPTWNKNLSSPIGAAWAKAASWLANAAEIRILGYSLPQTDIYVKHLFSTALMESENLQQIDILCLDPDGSVKARFDGMFTFPRYRFHNVDLENYLVQFWSRGHSRDPFRTTPVDTEDLHRHGLRSTK